MGWQFWIDRGGTFTDIVAQNPEGGLVVHKLLSENPEEYEDAALQGIREVMGIPLDTPIPTTEIDAIKMGTTVGTNALLERKGERIVLVITQGFGDALRIGYQNRPDIFAQKIILPQMLYERVIEVEERCDAQGKVLIPLNIAQVTADLLAAYHAGIPSCAIVLMHGYRYPHHEKQIEAIARKIGFHHISVSHKVSPSMKLVSRGDTTVVDAYLSPILRRYVNQVQTQLDQTKLMFMQSNGGLVDANSFQGKDSILSGPAGGIVGAVKTSEREGLKKIITFDMGGTSTDVAHYAGEYERSLETEIAGVRLRTPMMSIHTVAAGGGSILEFDGARYRVGPESAGANPGPACYGKGGPLTVTDCNVMVGKLQPEFFGNLSLDKEVIREKFRQLTAEIKDNRTPEQVATGFLAIAVQKMANAIKKVSLQRGYDVTEYTLCCFGGAGGQHACLIADALGIKQIIIHPYAGVLSAYGIGLADRRILRQKAMEAVLTSALIPHLDNILAALVEDCQGELKETREIIIRHQVYLKYEGTDSTILVNFEDVAGMKQQFESIRRQRYGFIVPEKQLIVAEVGVELICPTFIKTVTSHQLPVTSTCPVGRVPMYTKNQWWDTPVFYRESLRDGDVIAGPAIIVEGTGTNVIEPGWEGVVTRGNNLFLIAKLCEALRSFAKQPPLASRRYTQIGDGSPPAPRSPLDPPATRGVTRGAVRRGAQRERDPVLLEIFNNLFRSIAEQMGTTLQNTSYSVNIKERLDFSCAIFDGEGKLVANAPHIPVHLGSMSHSVRSLIATVGEGMKRGDVYIANNPYNGGTHLPDITAIAPVFVENESQPLFYVASRGHHADIGGITPGSMAPHSKIITEEGILIDNFQLMEGGNWRGEKLVALLEGGKYPARNSGQNMADLQAQIAANEKGMRELESMVEYYGTSTVKAYMGYVQDNASECVVRAMAGLEDGSFSCELDQGGKICVTITINRESDRAKIDFGGTSGQLESNFNAPAAVCQAAVLYVFRTLVKDDIPLNEGCLRPLDIIIPPGCMLNPEYPAAVVAGNVETSQKITNCLYGALGIMAASQGTMNNFTIGNEQYQYYETICGGSGAGVDFEGTDAVQTHMTNSRLTDPEVLEWRFPVLLESFAIRPHSGGKGRHRGGNGTVRRIRFLQAMTGSILSDSRVIAPFGLKGGSPGAVGKNWVERKDGTVVELGGTATVEMEPGDTFVIATPGGGGYGS